MREDSDVAGQTMFRKDKRMTPQLEPEKYLPVPQENAEARGDSSLCVFVCLQNCCFLFLFL